jgi:hypothetical protein
MDSLGASGPKVTKGFLRWGGGMEAKTEYAIRVRSGF